MGWSVRIAVTACALVVAGTGSACRASTDSDDLGAVPYLEEPASVLANSEYPDLDPAGLVSQWALATDNGLTQVLSFVEGLTIDESVARTALSYFEQLRMAVPLQVDGDGPVLTFRVAPRNSPRRYVIIVPDGSPLPIWARDRGDGVSFTQTRPVNIDQVVTFVRLGAEPLPVDSSFEAVDAARRLDATFVRTACVRSTTVNTDPEAAVEHGAEIHNRGEGVVCGREHRQLIARALGWDTAAAAEAEESRRTTTFSDQTLTAPPFDSTRYEQLPALGRIFTISAS